MLLGANHHSWSHESHESNDLVGGKTMFVDQVCPDQAACSTKTGLAVHSNSLLLCNRVVCQLDKLTHNRKSRACAIFEDHVDVLDPESSEVAWAVELRI
jgi:hypothetical protein